MSAPGISPRLFIASRCAQTIFNQRLSLAEFAVSEGWEVQLSGDVSPGDYVQLLIKGGFNFFPVPVDQKSLNPVRLLRLIAAYIWILKRTRPRVFHAFTIKPIICGLIAARLAGVPVCVATVPGLGHAFLSPAKWVRFVASLLFKVAFLFADVVVFYNQEDRNELLKRKLVRPEKSRLIPSSGINLAHFEVAHSPKGNTTKFLFIGRLLTEKGLPELLGAMEIVREKNIDVELHLVGDCDPNNPSSLTRDAVDQAVNRGLAKWHGLVADVRPFIAAAHVVILPSHREGIPLCLLEGAAMGRALIATDVPGCRDVVIPNKTGLLVPVKDPMALADAIIALATDRERVRNMGLAARDDVVARFDTKVVNAKVVEVYEEMLRTRGVVVETQPSVS
jgi:glycosyltransferase involved in cell wall biosynthesis